MNDLTKVLFIITFLFIIQILAIWLLIEYKYYKWKLNKGLIKDGN